MIQIARHLFRKLFRGGSVDLGYLCHHWCDAVLELPYQSQPKNEDDTWLHQLLTTIEEMPDDCSLTDLVKCCKGLVGGGKAFKHAVLESLAIAGVLRVHDKPIENLFLPEHRYEDTPHFYANEWGFPLRWWVTNGGSVDRRTFPQ